MLVQQERLKDIIFPGSHERERVNSAVPHELGQALIAINSEIVCY
jgi:hypothetical protein